MIFPDGSPEARAALERQLMLLTAVADSLRSVSTGRPPLVSENWRGSAADAAERFLSELDAGLRGVTDLVDDTIRTLRVLLATR